MAELESFDDFILSVLRETWETFRREAMVYVLAGVVLALLSVVSLGLLVGPLTIGFIELVRQGRRSEPLAVSVLFSRFDTWVPSTIAVLLIVVTVAIGMCLLVAPGLIAALFSVYSLHAIAYEGVTGIDAIRRSIALVRASFLPTLSLVFLISVAHASGGSVLFGVLLTTPLSLIALTLGYERIAGVKPSSVVYSSL